MTAVRKLSVSARAILPGGLNLRCGIGSRLAGSWWVECGFSAERRRLGTWSVDK
jgi:hypothetical protein